MYFNATLCLLAYRIQGNIKIYKSSEIEEEYDEMEATPNGIALHYVEQFETGF